MLNRTLDITALNNLPVWHVPQCSPNKSLPALWPSNRRLPPYFSKNGPGWDDSASEESDGEFEDDSPPADLTLRNPQRVWNWAVYKRIYTVKVTWKEQEAELKKELEQRKLRMRFYREQNKALKVSRRSFINSSNAFEEHIGELNEREVELGKEIERLRTACEDLEDEALELNGTVRWLRGELGWS